MHCDDRHNRRLRDLEIAGITQAMNESQDLHREESRAARRKYREERRARIIQLFTPVRMILTEENFIRSETDTLERTIQKKTEDKVILDDKDSSSSAAAAASEVSNSPPSSISDNAGGEEYSEDDVNDTFILIPKPGLPDGASIYEFNNNTVAASRNQDFNDLRQVPNECSICLCEYTVGSDAVWSSNPQCDHVFHADCIEQWLMKQRDGPLCPCCRRDFVIDPFDVGPGENDDLESGNGNNHSTDTGERIIAPSVQSPALQQQQQQRRQQYEESMSRIIDESSDDSLNIPQHTITEPNNGDISSHSDTTEAVVATS